MPRRSAAVAVPPTSYEKLAYRIEMMIKSPRAQIDKSLVIERLEHESREDWQRLINEIAENEYVSVRQEGNDVVRLTWTEM